jgi:GNAT superfamily N-acetyltransferase
VTAARPGEGPSIRPAIEADLPVITGMFQELAVLQEPWRVFPPRSNVTEEMRRRFHADLADPDAVVLVAEQDGRVIGMAAGHVHKPSMMSGELAVELGSVFVEPAHRGRGVAAALTAEVARFAQERGVERITLKTFAQNAEALLAWERMGFEPRMVQMTAPAARLRAQDRADPALGARS